MKNKYVMTVSQNKTLIENRRYDYIYNNMILARYDVTEEQVRNPSLLKEGSEEAIALRNFHAAYDYLLANTHEDADYGVLLKLHEILMNGLMEDIKHSLSEEQIMELYEMINQPTKANTEIAIDVMIHILKKRLFADGDVRVALMFANKIMLDNGCGFITVKPYETGTFRELLKKSNEEDQSPEFKEWIYKYCVKGRRFDNL